MKYFLVGGAVRDQLLGLPVKDRDWVVVGATPEDMLAAGFVQVGADFPVFLHPDTKEEYALARTERKSGVGYKGFICDFSPRVTLEDDLLRRDLTINAMALAEDGTLIDPYGGKQDLEQKRLRHVSDAFREDPLRVLRVARFASRLAPLGFQVAEETLQYMREMSDSGELAFLTPERVWQETERALGEQMPWVYFQVLRDCHALKVIMPELDALFGVPQPPQHHPEIDTGLHSLLVLEQAAKLSDSTEVRFAALVHDLGKGTTPEEMLPRHLDHEQRGLKLIKRLCQRLKVPNAHQALALLASEYHTHCHRALELRPSTIVKLLKHCDAFRRPERFEQFLQVCEADARGRTGLEQRVYPQPELLRAALAAARTVSAKELAAQGLSGAEIGERLAQLQSQAVAEAIRLFKAQQNIADLSVSDDS